MMPIFWRNEIQFVVNIILLQNSITIKTSEDSITANI